MTFRLVHHSYGLSKRQALKLVFFTPCIMIFFLVRVAGGGGETGGRSQENRGWEVGRERAGSGRSKRV